MVELLSWWATPDHRITPGIRVEIVMKLPDTATETSCKSPRSIVGRNTDKAYYYNIVMDRKMTQLHNNTYFSKCLHVIVTVKSLPIVGYSSDNILQSSCYMHISWLAWLLYAQPVTWVNMSGHKGPPCITLPDHTPQQQQSVPCRKVLVWLRPRQAHSLATYVCIYICTCVRMS